MSRLFVELAMVAGLVSAVAWADHVCGRGALLSAGLRSSIPADPQRQMSVTVMDLTTGRTRFCQQLGAIIACH